MAAAYSQIGGVRVGEGMFLAFNATWPFAMLRVDDAQLTLSCLGKRWAIPKTHIRRLRKHAGIISAGLQIEHRLEKYDEYIVFGTFGFNRLQEELERRGYVVS